jgi:excisionase family DNA binding protein
MRKSESAAHRPKDVRPGSLKYAAGRIGCSLPKLYQLIDDGKLRSYHIGRAHRVSESAIDDCIALLEREDSRARMSRTQPLND